MKKTGIVLISMDEVLARCKSPLLLLIREFVRDKILAVLLPQIFMEDLTSHLPLDD
jgi:hypothetical protein